MKYNQIIYQIFVRNYSKEGTFEQVMNDLPRIKKLGATIIYLMPIHQIGVKARKGTYGSPYAIQDYFSISHDLGDLKSFKALIDKTHDMGMKIILDMVFNHTSPDNVLLKDHEDYYYHKNGKLSNRVGDWTDIVDLDTFRDDTQEYLLSVLKYYVDLGVDGFRFDVASMIPLEFFKKARKAVGKDIIFIGESIDPEFGAYLRSINDCATLDEDMYPTFDSLYNYNYFHTMMGYINGKDTLSKLVERINLDRVNTRMLCLENHDNDRISSILDNNKLSKWLDFFAFIRGQVFIFAGQEFGNKHKPELFEKDPVDFNYVDEQTFNLYKDFIQKKLSQKDIVEQHIDVIGENKVSVKVKYIDGTEEAKQFILPKKD